MNKADEILKENFTEELLDEWKAKASKHHTECWQMLLYCIAEIRRLWALEEPSWDTFAEILAVNEEASTADIMARHPIIPVIADALYACLNEIGGPNYLELKMLADGQGKQEEIAVTIQRVEGKSPDERRQEAEAEARNWESACDNLARKLTEAEGRIAELEARDRIAGKMLDDLMAGGEL